MTIKCVTARIGGKKGWLLALCGLLLVAPVYAQQSEEAILDALTEAFGEASFRNPETGSAHHCTEQRPIARGLIFAHVDNPRVQAAVFSEWTYKGGLFGASKLRQRGEALQYKLLAIDERIRAGGG